MRIPAQHQTAATLAAVTGIAALGLGAGPAAADAPDTLRYVALGDSYSAGWGDLPLDPGHRSCAPAPRRTTRTSSPPPSVRS